MSEKQSRLEYQVIGMSCVYCAKLVKKSLDKHEGVKDVKVNPIMNAFYIDYDPNKVSEEEVEKAIKETGYKVVKLHGMKSNQ